MRISRLSLSEPSSPPEERTSPQKEKVPLPSQWGGGEYQRIVNSRKAAQAVLPLAKEEKLPKKNLLEAFARIMAVAKTDPETERKADGMTIGPATKEMMRRAAISLESSKGTRCPPPYDRWFEAGVSHDMALLRALLEEYYERI